jgi:hypothetical protein
MNIRSSTIRLDFFNRVKEEHTVHTESLTASSFRSLYSTFCHFIRKAKTKQDLQLR